MSITEKYKGKIIKKVSNTGVPREEFNELTAQMTLLNNQINNGKQQLVDKLSSKGLSCSIDNSFEQIADIVSDLYRLTAVPGTTITTYSNTNRYTTASNATTFALVLTTSSMPLDGGYRISGQGRNMTVSHIEYECRIDLVRNGTVVSNKTHTNYSANSETFTFDFTNVKKGDVFKVYHRNRSSSGMSSRVGETSNVYVKYSEKYSK